MMTFAELFKSIKEDCPAEQVACTDPDAASYWRTVRKTYIQIIEKLDIYAKENNIKLEEKQDVHVL